MHACSHICYCQSNKLSASENYYVNGVCFKLLMLVHDSVSDMRSSAVWFFSLCSNSSRLCWNSCDCYGTWWSGPTDCCCLSTFSNIWNGTELFLACEHLGWNCNRCHFMHTLNSVACLGASATHSLKLQSVLYWSGGWGKEQNMLRDYFWGQVDWRLHVI